MSINQDFPELEATIAFNEIKRQMCIMSNRIVNFAFNLWRRYPMYITKDFYENVIINVEDWADDSFFPVNNKQTGIEEVYEACMAIAMEIEKKLASDERSILLFHTIDKILDELPSLCFKIGDYALDYGDYMPISEESDKISKEEEQ